MRMLDFGPYVRSPVGFDRMFALLEKLGNPHQAIRTVHIAGTKGKCLVDCTANRHQISGETTWRYNGPNNEMYQTEHDELFAAIRAGKPINHGTWMAHSTMLAILGRLAAYTGQVVTWEEAMNAQEELAPRHLTWDTPLEVPPVAMPGKTKLV